MSIIKWITPVITPELIFTGLREYPRYLWSWNQYTKLPGAEKLMLRDSFPCLHDRTSITQIDAHYFYQNIWAMKRIKASGVAEHIDVGSLASFVGLLSTIVKVTFIDIRPLKVDLDNFDSRAGTILNLPLGDDTVSSLSCLHVAEHIGLGRYGDPLDPLGTQKACQELSRVLSRDGYLYFSLPVGKPRVCFNAHRIHSPHQILDYFSGLKLVEFSAVTDQGRFIENVTLADLETADYACGMFCFSK